MTEKLYYQDPFLRTFTASVLSCEPGRDGTWLVTLDRTAFYPEGGGQPGDTGALGDTEVLDTHERDGLVLHTCRDALPAGAQVSGAICWDRRFDHMQQHSGEHVVSGFLCRRYGCDNVGFHLGKDTVTVDFNFPIPPEDLPAIEEEVNAYLWQDRAVEIRSLEGEALRQAEYRSKKFIPGLVRLVSFPGADCCACCGTHVSRAGQIGLVKLLSCQTFREGVRIEMLCGGRALRYLNGVLDQNARVSHALSAKVMETAAAVERLQGELYRLRGRLRSLEEADIARRAESLRGAGDVVLLEPEMDADALRRLCDSVGQTCGGRCAVFAGADGDYRYAVLCGRETDVRSFAAAMNQALRGRGGGKSGFLQGSCAASGEEIRAYFDALWPGR